MLTRLERVGLIDDEAFARQYAEHRFGARKEGSRAVAQGLRRRGDRPRPGGRRPPRGPRTTTRSGRPELARSRATRLGGVAPEKAFARLSSLLMRRGYSPQIARSAARKALEIPFLDGLAPCVSRVPAVASGKREESISRTQTSETTEGLQ